MSNYSYCFLLSFVAFLPCFETAHASEAIRSPYYFDNPNEPYARQQFESRPEDEEAYKRRIMIHYTLEYLCNQMAEKNKREAEEKPEGPLPSPSEPKNTKSSDASILIASYLLTQELKLFTSIRNLYPSDLSNQRNEGHKKIRETFPDSLADIKKSLQMAQESECELISLVNQKSSLTEEKKKDKLENLVKPLFEKSEEALSSLFPLIQKNFSRKSYSLESLYDALQPKVFSRKEMNVTDLENKFFPLSKITFHDRKTLFEVIMRERPPHIDEPITPGNLKNKTVKLLSTPYKINKGSFRPLTWASFEARIDPGTYLVHFLNFFLDDTIRSLYIEVPYIIFNSNSSLKNPYPLPLEIKRADPLYEQELREAFSPLECCVFLKSSVFKNSLKVDLPQDLEEILKIKFYMILSS